jgi:spermidine/putrescine transport system ATP-binding protein
VVQAADGATAGDLRLLDVTKRFGAFVAVEELSLHVPHGSFFALLGPSGCGKTTTLRMVAGLEQPSSGRVLLGGADITDRRPYKRPVNTVFQSYALFPHLDVYENVAFGLRRRGIRDVTRQVGQMLELVELAGYERRRPAQLSGGQQQRVALARALINRPEVLLLDEPLGALDLKLRRQMQLELKRIQTDVGITFVQVTHDQEEAMTMADTIAVMNQGRVEQLADPATLYDTPATTFVANFLGQSNLLRATVTGRAEGRLLADVHGRRLALPARRGGPLGGQVWLGVRPEKVVIAPAPAPDRSADSGLAAGARNVLDGVLVDAGFVGVSTQYLVRLPWGQELVVFAQNLTAGPQLRPGQHVQLHWDPEHTFVLDAAQDADAGAGVDGAATPDPVGAPS